MKRANAGLVRGMAVTLLAGTALGIVAANVCMTEGVREASPFQALLSGDATWMCQEGFEVFFSIFSKRLCLFLILLLASCVKPFLPSAAFLGLASGWFLGVYLGGAVLACGAAGFGLSLAALFPQIIFYGGAAWLLLHNGWQREKGRNSGNSTFITHILGAAGVYFMGILTESCWNPAAIRFFLKLFR